MPRWGMDPVTFTRADTIQSALGKLDRSENSAPIVVLASDCRIADSVVLYSLLARRAKRFGLPIAVVSAHPYRRRLAREQGLYAFGSLGALKRARGRSPISWLENLADSLFFSMRPTIGRQGWICLGLLSLVAGVLAYLFLPQMTVTVRTPVETFPRDVQVRVDAGLGAVDPSAPVIPGKLMEHRFAVSDYVESTGDKKTGKAKGRGEVTLTSRSAGVGPVPAGTVVATGSGVKFRTLAAANLTLVAQPAPTPSAAGAQPTAQPTTAASWAGRVAVEAVEAGSAGNVPAMAITRVEGEQFRSLAVYNDRPVSGGSDSEARTVSADDRSRLKEVLFQKAQSQSLSELTVRVRQSESLIPHSLQIRIEGEEFDRAVDEEGDRLNGTVHVAATGMSFANQELNSVVDRDWKKNVPKGYRAIPGMPELSPPEVVEAGARTGTLKVRMVGHAETILEVDRLVARLRGLSLEDARAKLASEQGALKLVKLDIWPSWAPRALRVEVRTVQ